MALNVECPKCGTRYGVSDTLLGQRIKCRSCDARFEVEPSDAEDEKPVKPRNNTALIVTLLCAGGGALLLILVVGGFVALKALGWLSHTADKQVQRQQETGESSDAMSLVVYLAERPDAPTEVEVEAQLSDVYLGSYINKRDSYYSISLIQLGKAGCFAYIRRDSDPGKELFIFLKDGNRHRMILTLQMHKTPTGDDVEIRQ
jgi:predicted Zn finger-like uncharacterized protein